MALFPTRPCSMKTLLLTLFLLLFAAPLWAQASQELLELERQLRESLAAASARERVVAETGAETANGSR